MRTKVYALRVKGDDGKVTTTYHKTFTEVPAPRGERMLKQGTGPALEPKDGESTVRVAAIGNGEYLLLSDLNAEELSTLKSVTNVKRIVNPRYIAAVKQIRHLMNGVKNNMVELSDHHKSAILNGLAEEMAELERAVLNIKKTKDTIKGIV